MGRRIRETFEIAILVTLLAASAAAGDTVLEERMVSETASDLESFAEDAASEESEESSAATQDDPPPPVSGLSKALSKLTVHGFLTQAWATADFLGGRFPGPGGAEPGPTFDELALGIPEDGTFNYRTMALQFRYDISPKDVMVVQLSSRALGDSPVNEVEDDLELDWAFYERRLTDNTSIKIGRVQIPLGIFNEIRDVGTILPFYRPPFTFYREGTFTSETVDGVDLSHTFNADSDWSVDFDVYVGRWESFELSFFDESITLVENEGFGFQLWLNTPVSGLRFGFGGHTRDASGGSEGALREVGAESTFDDYYFSIDGVFNRFVFRAEHRQFDGDPEPVPAFGGGIFEGKVVFYYGQLGFHATDKFRIYVQAEIGESNDNFATTFTEPFSATLREDYGIALNYLFNNNLVLKAEYHEVEGEDIGFAPVFLPTGFLLQPLVKGLDSGSYSILSLSASF